MLNFIKLKIRERETDIQTERHTDSGIKQMKLKSGLRIEPWSSSMGLGALLLTGRPASSQRKFIHSSLSVLIFYWALEEYFWGERNSPTNGNLVPILGLFYFLRVDFLFLLIFVLIVFMFILLLKATLKKKFF